MNSVESILPSELQLADEEVYLGGVVRQDIIKQIPNQGANGYTYSGTNQIEFNLQHSDAINLAQTYLEYHPKMDDASGSLTWAPDVFSRVEVYLDGAEIINTATYDIRQICNYQMLCEANGDWFHKEGSVLCGFCLPRVSSNASVNNTIPAQAISGTAGRKVCVPLWAIHPAFAMSRVMPILGSQLRIVLHLSEPQKVLDRVKDATTYYTIDDVALKESRVLLSPEYKQALMRQVNSAEGFKIRCIDFQVLSHNVSNTSTQNLVVRNDFRNAKSLWVYNQFITRADTGGNATHHAWKSNLGHRTTELKATCGSVNLLGNTGSTSTAEHFVNLEKVCGTFANLNSSGAYNYHLYTDNNDDVSGNFSVSPLAISLEKLQLSDLDVSVMNNGLSGTDDNYAREIYVDLTTSGNMDNSAERLYTAMVFEKTINFSSGMVSVEK